MENFGITIKFVGQVIFSDISWGGREFKSLHLFLKLK